MEASRKNMLEEFKNKENQQLAMPTHHTYWKE
jgi:hypothetical protein